MSHERVLNFDQWKKFSKNYEPITVWLWLVYKITENNCRSPISFKLKRGILPPLTNKYSNWKTTCHTKSTISLWTKLLANKLLVKYLKSIPVVSKKEVVEYSWNQLKQRCIKNPVEHLQWQLLAKIVHGFYRYLFL